MATRLTVVHRNGCGLCDEMLRDLDSLRERAQIPPISVVDVDSDAQLARRYGLNVPVLLLDDVLVCRHRLDAAELLRMLGRAEG